MVAIRFGLTQGGCQPQGNEEGRGSLAVVTVGRRGAHGLGWVVERSTEVNNAGSA